MFQKKGRVICVTSTKGGVGKTILTMNLAGMYQLLEKKTLIIDMDLYNGAIALNLNVDPVKTIYHFTDDLSNNRYEEDRDYITKYNDFIDILASPKDPRQASKIDSKYLEMIISRMRHHYDVVLIDTTHILDKTNIMTMDHSDVILYVLTNDPMNLKSAKAFMAIMHDIERENVKVVLNESVFPARSYFSKFDMKNVMKHSIDYTISKNLYIRNIDKYLIEGGIIVTNRNLSWKEKKDYEKMRKMALDLVKEEKRG